MEKFKPSLRRNRLLQVVTLGPALILVLALIGTTLIFTSLQEQYVEVQEDSSLERLTHQLHAVFQQQQHLWQLYLLHKGDARWQEVLQQYQLTRTRAQELLALSRANNKETIETFLFANSVLFNAYNEAHQQIEQQATTSAEVLEELQGIENTPSALLQSLADDIALHTQMEVDQYQSTTQRLMVLGLLLLTATGALIIYAAYARTSRLLRQQQHSEAKAQWLASHDVVSELPNRISLAETMDELLRNKKTKLIPFYVLHIHLANFKQINNIMGFEESEDFILELTRRMQQTSNEGDYIARINTDEFIYLVRSLPRGTTLRDFLQSSVNVWQQSIQRSNYNYHFEFNIGVTEYPKNARTTPNLLKQADIAMHFASRKSHKLFQRYQERMDLALKQNEQIIRNLQRSVDEQNFFLLYQPQFCLKTGALVGIEALVRWRTPEGNFISPAEFIPLAEQSGLILPLGKWVLREACFQAKNWQERNIKLLMAINISARQLNDRATIDFLQDLIDDFVIDPQGIELELTESVFAENSRPALERLRSLNLKIALDDFGTGYSNLGYLNELPLDKLKIDRSFISELHLDAKKSNITSTILELGHNLGMTVLAEGVETQEELDHLKRLGCEEVQGYLLSTPLLPKDLETLYRRNAQAMISQ